MNLCPQYMAMGMTYEEFWNSNTKVHRAYRKAWDQKQREEEWSRWRMGAYIYDALLCVAPVMRAAFSKGKVEPGKYPNEPWPLTEKDVREREEKTRREAYKRFVDRIEAENKREEEKLKEEQKREEANEDG